MPQPTEKQRIGAVGEQIAVNYLKNKGFLILGRNYRKKYGEIDVIAQKGEIVHFVEVKTVSCEILPENKGFLRKSVSRGTDQYHPEDNVHPQKIKRLFNTFQAYLLEKYEEGEPEWVFDVIAIRLDTKNRRAKVRFLENLVI